MGLHGGGPIEGGGRLRLAGRNPADLGRELVGIGIGLMTRGLIERRPRVSVKKAEKLARTQAKQAAKDARREARAR